MWADSMTFNRSSQLSSPLATVLGKMETCSSIYITIGHSAIHINMLAETATKTTMRMDYFCAIPGTRDSTVK